MTSSSKLLLGLALACLLSALAPLVPARATGQAQAVAPAPQAWEWPTHWDGRPLRPLATTAVEQRFAAGFPGQLVRMADDEGAQVLLLRHVLKPTRLLHPAADCFRGLGYHMEPAQLQRDAQARLWRCAIATKGGERLRVCERIESAAGEDHAPQAFTDTSSWFWAASLNQSLGPWLAVTTVTAVTPATSKTGLSF